MTWTWGVLFFFHLPYLILLLFCSYNFALSLDWVTVFVEIDNLSFDIYLLITVKFCFPNLDKKFFVLILAFIVYILLFSSKSHCSFKNVLIKRVYSLLLLSFINICVFFSCSIPWPVFTRLFRIITAYIESKN